MARLTERSVSALTIPAGRREAWASDGEVQGLRLRVTAGARTWFACWTDRATSERRRERLGVWPGLTLEKAREAARIRLGEVAKGIDPRAVRAAQRAAAERDKAEAAMTLERVVDDWAALHLVHRRPRYAAEAVRAVKVAFAKHLTKPAARLAKADAAAVLDTMARDGKATTAGLVLAYARACYGWAEKRGRVPSNPFANLPRPAPAVARDHVLTDEELGRIWNAALGLNQPWGPFTRIVMLTLARRDEAAGMRWSEISADLSTWTIPGSRMKRGQPHVVHLTEAARDALRGVARIKGQDLVFSTNGKAQISGFSMCKALLDKAAKVPGWRLHDMRRTGVSAIAAMGFNPMVADLLLAHLPQKLSTVARVYQRHDFAAERKAAMEAWSAHVLRCAEAKEDAAANVVPMRRVP